MSLERGTSIPIFRESCGAGSEAVHSALRIRRRWISRRDGELQPRTWRQRIWDGSCFGGKKGGDFGGDRWGRGDEEELGAEPDVILSSWKMQRLLTENRNKNMDLPKPTSHLCKNIHVCVMGHGLHECPSSEVQLTTMVAESKGCSSEVRLTTMSAVEMETRGR
ncbi:unnamed protein product [Linum trigynum]|uniref:Uncharacterized protein n=1 Tax=Linum trigynum TaxID=586398 RepID=A0AAV2DL01_9ROSI